MENATFIALTRQKALKTAMDVSANNVANMSTPGYQGEKVIFREFLQEPENLERPVSQVLDFGRYRDLSTGGVRQTGNPLDVALQGPGYFSVQSGEDVRYTRGGDLITNNEGILVNARGDAMLDPGGNPIVIPPEAQQITISANGTIATEDGAIGQLGVFEFADQQFLVKDPKGYLDPNGEQPQEAAETAVIQGVLENSNVDPINETTRMIDILRSYQSIQSTVETEDQRQLRMIRELSGGGG